MGREPFRKKLLAWYRKNARHDLPWRKTRDPYRIWVSESMLQQTQVATVIPYYRRFLRRFPSVKRLGRSPLKEVLEIWSGLGYYSRAKNLHAAAQEILGRYDGQIPNQVEDLLTLPGVGRYTAGAVASIAYDRPAPILDGNVTRVLVRYLGIREDPKLPAVQSQLWAVAEHLVKEKGTGTYLSPSPGEFNQALMELGALVCTPRRPNCPACPVSGNCLARRNGWQDRIPPPRPTPPRKKILYLCGILERDGSLLLARRPLSGLLPGLWEFPGGEKGPAESEPQGLIRLLQERLGIRVEPGKPRATLKQTLSHRELEIRAFDCRFDDAAVRPRWYLETGWVPRRNLGKMALTAGMRRLAQTLLCALFLAGCATVAVGPPIDPEELKSTELFYQVKARRHLYNQVIRVRTIGERLLTAVPEEKRLPDPDPQVGLLLDNLTQVSAQVFEIPGMEPDPDGPTERERKPWKHKKACLIVGVLPGSPASEAGIEPGDLLIQVEGRKTPTVRQAAELFSRLEPHDTAHLLLERRGAPFEQTLTVGAKDYPAIFHVSDDDSVNAYASPGLVVVSAGLLRFVQSDDELAVVMGHELAHLTQGHIGKAMAPNLLGGLLGSVVGSAAEIVFPGSGSKVGRVPAAGITAPFSKDFEREADRVGLEYTHRAGYQIEAGITFWDRFATELGQSLSPSYLNTHPTSPERLLRIKKTIEELKAE